MWRVWVLLGFVSCLWGKPLQVEIAAPSAIVMNSETGAILYEKNSHKRGYPASITKIAVALYVLEKTGHTLDRMAKVTPHALHSVPWHVRQAPDTAHPPYRLEHDGTMMGLKAGEEHTLKTFLYGLMLPSGNDAANVLAEHMSGSIEKFMQELQNFIESRGIKESHFVNPHGLHHSDHWTTPYDMALLTQQALQYPVFREIVKATKYLRPKSSKQPPGELYQHNRLVKPGAHYYSKAIGVKIGRTSKAGNTIVAAATHEGRELIAVLMGCPEGRQHYQDTIRLFEAAFAEKPLTRVLFAKESEKFSHAVRGAKKKLVAHLREDLALQYFPAEEPAFRAEIEWIQCRLPIRQGESVGFLRLVGEGERVLKQLPLIAVEELGQKWWHAPVEFFKSYRSFFVGLFLVVQVGLFLFYFLKKNQKIFQR